MDQFYLLSTLIQSCEQFSIYIFWWYSERAVSSGEMSDIKFSGSTCSKWTSGRANVCLNQFTVVKRRLKVVSRKNFFSGSFRRSANANAEANWNLFVFQCNRWKFILEFQRQIKSYKIRLRSHSDRLAREPGEAVILAFGICKKEGRYLMILDDTWWYLMILDHTWSYLIILDYNWYDNSYDYLICPLQ